MNTSPDTDITTRARRLYRELGPRVEPATAARLRAARRTALEKAPSRARRHIRWMVPAGAFAMAALAVLVNWQPFHGDTRPAPSVASGGATADQLLPPDADQTDPALYQDMDFYAWLADQPAVASQASRR